MTNPLDLTPEDTPDPILLPNGVYDFKITWTGSREDVGENQQSVIELSAKATAIVDSPELPDSDLKYAKPVRMTFWMDEDTLASESPTRSAKAFFTKTMGFPANLSYKQLAEMALGQEFRAATNQFVKKGRDTPEVGIRRFVTG